MADFSREEITNGVEFYGNVKVGPKGQVVIPNELRKKLDVKPGDNLMVGTKYGKLIWFIKPNDVGDFVESMNEEVENSTNYADKTKENIEKFKRKLDQ